jgi:molybdenum cofactor cytidylyltransferase
MLLRKTAPGAKARVHPELSISPQHPDPRKFPRLRSIRTPCICYLHRMSSALSFCGVILAAGASSRMGKDKALLAWPPAGGGSGTLLSAAIRALSPFNDMVIVVAGKNAADITPIVDANGGFHTVNPDPDRGQFSSLQCGLQEVLNRGRDAAMITLVDKPPVKPSTLEKLREEFDSAMSEGKWAVVPEYGGRHGHPILIGREMIEVFLKAPATAIARDIEHQHQSRIQYAPVDDPDIALNLNTPEDYAALASQSA